MDKKVFIAIVLAFIAGIVPAYSQASWIRNTASDEHYPTVENLQKSVNILCDRKAAEKGRDALGVGPDAEYISSVMAECELRTIGDTYIHPFTSVAYGIKGANVVGMMEGYRRTSLNRYIIVGAHYDNLGIIDGKHYPGADSNASGVAAMLEIARTFRAQRLDYLLYNSNIIFVAFDRYMDGRSGSEEFWRSLEDGLMIDPVSHNAITPQRITAMIDIDQIGCTLEPVKKERKDYIIALGESSMVEKKKGVLERCNDFYGIGLDINTTYYGSERFTKTFYRLGDQRKFIDCGIPAMLFTSGITDNNNRTTDTPDTIDWEILRKRAILIFRFLEKMM